MKHLWVMIVFGMLAIFLSAFEKHSPQPNDPNSPAELSFEALRGLAGTWSGGVTTDPHNAEIEGPIQVTMRVASHGTALIHEIAPGGVPEPTMIFVRSNRLTMVHYCEAGNQPRLVVRTPGDTKKIVFDFADMSGTKEPLFLNHLAFALIDASRHTEDWTFQMPDSSVLHAHFDLKRAPSGVHAATPKKS